MCRPTRRILPITIADGRPVSAGDVVAGGTGAAIDVTRLVIALLLKTLYKSSVGSIRTFSVLKTRTNRKSTRLTHGYRYAPLAATFTVSLTWFRFNTLYGVQGDAAVPAQLLTVNVRVCGSPVASRIEPDNCIPNGA